MNSSDKRVLRELAHQVAAIAALPVQEEKRVLWRKLNALQTVRPMVMIDQVCWNEMNVDNELTLRCEDAECRQFEDELRRVLFQWKHFPVDKVVDPFIRVQKAVALNPFGMRVNEKTSVGDPTNSVISHQYTNQFACDADLEKIRPPTVIHYEAETARRLEAAHDLFDGILEIMPWGADPYLSLWDPISMFMGMENALYAMIDRSDFMHALLQRMTDGYLGMLDQLEEQGLLCGQQSLIHCTGAFTDELPAKGYDLSKPRTKDLWMFGLAQMLGSVSPDMYQEFEVAYSSRLCERFGLVYYGCCEPLDSKMEQVRRIPNVRKISMSPWVDIERGAAEIGANYVFSRKPNPAMLAMGGFDADAVRADLTATRNTCEKHKCPLEIILKDISTVRYEPARLFAWAKTAMDVVED